MLTCDNGWVASEVYNFEIDINCLSKEIWDYKTRPTISTFFVKNVFI